MQLSPLHIKKKIVCKLLDISVNQLRKISLADENFPKHLKSGPTRQAGVYFDYQEIVEWHKKQLALR
ncbi:MAG: transcriptional regulator [Acinetobacter sp.]|nr:transcriptional regulator [Acinetobacter sp.]MDN5513516.1 transcriptional regulator [Acinetobacter sp.]